MCSILLKVYHGRSLTNLYFFNKIERLTRRYFYFEQWIEMAMPFENETIRETVFPVRENGETKEKFR